MDHGVLRRFGTVKDAIEAEPERLLDGDQSDTGWSWAGEPV